MANGRDHERERLLGWGGLSPRYWAVALELQEERFVEAHMAVVEAPPGSAERSTHFRRMHIEAHFLLIALGHVLRALDRCADVLREEEIGAIRADVQARAPWIPHFRNVLEHLDAYTRGEGQLQQSGELGPGDGPVLFFDPLAPLWEAKVELGGWKLPLRAAAKAGVTLGNQLAAAWEAQFGPEEQSVIWGRSG